MTESTQTPPPAKSDRVQFNARVVPELKTKVKMDGAQFGVTIDDITAAILQKFYTDHPTAPARREIYRKAGLTVA